MFKTVSSVVAALACVALASPSTAQSFSPFGGLLNGSGTVTVNQTTSVSCKLTVPVFHAMSWSHLHIPTHSLSPGTSMLCGTFATTYGIWGVRVVPGSTTKIDIDFGFNQTWPCYGTIRADWDNAAHKAVFTTTMLPPVNPAQPGCLVSGTIFIPLLQIL